MPTAGAEPPSTDSPILQSVSLDSFLTHSLGGAPLLEACLRLQYFPAIRQDSHELPPIFSTKTLTDELARKLANCSGPSSSTPVRIRTRRFDGLIRTLQIPHPVPYSNLVLHLHAHWDKLAPLLVSESSMVKPGAHPHDGRLVIMNYERPISMELRRIKASQGMRYQVQADIANCFPSIYTHAIDWALRGIDAAKADRSGSTWQAKLDKKTRNCQNQETIGLAIGPVTSNVLSELILQRVDEELKKTTGCDFTRYVDDYTAYFKDLDGAEHFVQSLDRHLLKYRLSLNTRKTKISRTDTDFGEEWIEQLYAHHPRRRNAHSLVRFLQACERLAHRYPDRSVMTFGTKMLLSAQRCPALDEPKRKWRRQPTARRDSPVLHQMLRSAHHHPHLFALFAQELRFVEPVLATEDRDILKKQLRIALGQALRREESDTSLWLIYCIRIILKARIPKPIIRLAFTLEDDLIALALAATTTEGRGKMVECAKSLNNSSGHVLGEHWLLRYEAFRVKALKEGDLHAEVEGPWFKLARRAGLTFTEGLK